jgi:hypothetical protein
MLGHHGCQQPLNGRPVRDVDRVRGRLEPLGGQLAGRALDRLGGAPHGHHRRAPGGEAARDRPADPACGARDERHPAPHRKELFDGSPHRGAQPTP